MKRRLMMSGIAAILALSGLPLAPVHAATAGPDWLQEVNRYRAGAGLNPVTENTSWTAGLRHHFTYLANTPSSYRTGQYANAHTENPASPYYTADGAKEGGSSDLYEGAYFSPLGFIDGWLTAPFHAIGMLRPNLTQVAFASDPATGSGGLDVISGLTGGSTPTQPVLFPGNGMTTNLPRFGGESPDPTETCHFSSDTQPGLPLIALLPEAPAADITATLKVGGQQPVGLCLVDEHHYTSSDAVYGETGRQILAGDHAVLLIPDRPLDDHSYTATISQTGKADIAWSFSVDTAGPAVAAHLPPTFSQASSVGFAYSATDPSGVSSYDVRYQRAPYNAGFGALTFPPTWQNRTDLSVTMAAARGYTTCWSARARDGLGNESDWSAQRCTAAALDDRSLVASAGWSRGSASAYYAGTISYAARPSATLTLTRVQARRISLVATTVTGGGTVGVYWNGALLKRISLAGGSGDRQLIPVADLGATRSGTLVIKTLNSGRVYLDGVGLSRV